eukprot:3125016-Rhodomonas_salina.3
MCARIPKPTPKKCRLSTGRRWLCGDGGVEQATAHSRKWGCLESGPALKVGGGAKAATNRACPSVAAHKSTLRDGMESQMKMAVAVEQRFTFSSEMAKRRISGVLGDLSSGIRQPGES